MNMKTTCFQCGSDKLCVGNLWGKWEVYFRPDPVKFPTLSPGAKTTAVACLECGAISLWADPDKIKSVMKEKA